MSAMNVARAGLLSSAVFALSAALTGCSGSDNKVTEASYMGAVNDMLKSTVWLQEDFHESRYMSEVHFQDASIRQRVVADELRTKSVAPREVGDRSGLITQEEFERSFREIEGSALNLGLASSRLSETASALTPRGSSAFGPEHSAMKVRLASLASKEGINLEMAKFAELSARLGAGETLSATEVEEFLASVTSVANEMSKLAESNDDLLGEVCPNQSSMEVAESAAHMVDVVASAIASKAGVSDELLKVTPCMVEVVTRAITQKPEL